VHVVRKVTNKTYLNVMFRLSAFRDWSLRVSVKCAGLNVPVTELSGLTCIRVTEFLDYL